MISTDKRQSRLTGGDAAVVIALLLFILLYLSGWVFLLGWAESDGDLEKIDGWGGALLLIAVAWPPVWAGGQVRSIIEGTES